MTDETLIPITQDERDELERLRSWTRHLPQTADGCPVIPGAEVCYIEGGAVIWVKVFSINCKGYVRAKDAMGWVKLPATQCFNFERNAVAARAAAQPGDAGEVGR